MSGKRPGQVVRLAVSACLAFVAGCSSGSYRMRPPPPRNASIQGNSSGRGASLADLGVPAQSLPAPGEEVWIIEKSAGAAASPEQGAELEPGCGMLLDVHGGQLTPFAITRTAVKADIHGCIASVGVRQRFTNPARQTAEAAYVFPLPQNAAVSDFVMSLGNRHIRGIIRESAEAHKIYEEAKSLGFLASLMVQSGPNVFVQHVANLAPGGQIDVEIQYFHTLPYRDGWFVFELPLISGPRGAGWPKRRERDGRDVSVAIHLDAEFPIAKVECPTHKMSIAFTGNTIADATLIPADKIPNVDLMLRYKPGGGGMASALTTQPDGNGGVFSLLLAPPDRPGDFAERPLEMIFAIAGDAGKSGTSAASQLLRTLKPSDTFAIVRVDRDGAVPLTDRLTPATADNAEHYASILSQVSPSGRGDVLAAAMKQPRDPARLRCICLVTIGSDNLQSTLADLEGISSADHVLVLGAGRDVHRDAINAIARAGCGAEICLMSAKDSQSLLADLTQRLRHPALTDWRINWDGAGISEIYPHPAPDLFPGRAVLLTGRYDGSPPRSVTIQGRVGGRPVQWKIPARALPAARGRSPIASVWARMKIADLTLAAARRPNPLLPDQVRQIALSYGLLSRYTAFVGVDALTRAPLNDPPAPQRTQKN